MGGEGRRRSAHVIFRSPRTAAHLANLRYCLPCRRASLAAGCHASRPESEFLIRKYTHTPAYKYRLVFRWAPGPGGGRGGGCCAPTEAGAQGEIKERKKNVPAAYVARRRLAPPLAPPPPPPLAFPILPARITFNLDSYRLCFQFQIKMFLLFHTYSAFVRLNYLL